MSFQILFDLAILCNLYIVWIRDREFLNKIYLRGWMWAKFYV